MKRFKLPLSFLLIILFFISCGAFTLLGLVKLENHNRKIYKHPFTVSKASLQVALHITKMHRNMKDIVLSSSSDEITMRVQELAVYEQEVHQDLALIHQYILGEEGHSLERQAKKLFIAWEPIRRKVFHFLEAGNRERAVSITKEEGAEHVEKLENQAMAMTAYAANKAAEILSHAEEAQAEIKRTTIIWSLACVLIALVISSYATNCVFASEKNISDKNISLQKALDEIKTLRGLLPICCYCKKIRDTGGDWQIIEHYIHQHSHAQFSHGMCPECYKREMEGIDEIFNPLTSSTEHNDNGSSAS